MIRRVSAVLLLLVLVPHATAAATLESPDAPSQTQTAQAKRQARVFQANHKKTLVVLQDKTRLVGYISEVREDQFMLTDHSSGTERPISFNEVHHIQRSGMSTRKKVLIGVGIGFVGLFVVACIGLAQGR